MSETYFDSTLIKRKVVDSIKTTKKKRKRRKANSNTILNFVRQEYPDIEKSHIDAALKELIVDGIVIKKGEVGDENYFLSTDKAIQTDVSVETCTNNISQSHKNESLSNNLAIKYYVALIDQLKDEITHLRKECTSKNSIIKQLIDSQSINSVNEHCKKDFTSRVINCETTDHNKTNDFKNALNRELHNVETACSNNSQDNNSEDVRFNIDEKKKYHQNNFTNVSKKRNKKTRSTSILMDSIGKDIQSHEMRKGLSNKTDKVYVKSFSGSTTEDMRSYAVPSINYGNDLYILHISSNNLRSEATPEVIANEIINLAKFIKSDGNDVMISSIVERSDNVKLNDKGKQVNILLKKLCASINFIYIDNSNIHSKRHLNGSGLHLNYSGTVTLANNLLDAINL